jgi:uncharacterized pyridoxamine 5'-phosphate oxidase family protein
MSNQKSIKKHVEEALQSNQLAVMATVGEDQPRASLIAITLFKGFRQLIFTTYRNTRKYRNLLSNGKVAILIEGANEGKSGIQNGFVITAYGLAEEISLEANDTALHEYLNKYPELLSFTEATDCALKWLMLINTRSYRGLIMLFGFL